jgi:hypothetical protein
MRWAPAVILAAILGLFSGCLERSKEAPQAEVMAPGESAPSSPDPATYLQRKTTAQTASANPSADLMIVEPAAERKVIRNAELTLELSNPEEGKRKIEAITESCNGFVVSSEAISQEEAGARASVTVVVRIPATKFGAVLEEIRKLGYKIKREKITGQDVTEEYIDIEARLKAKKAVESQFLEIMKQARQVSDALEVQKALGEVRSEIEQIEGRRRFLENQVNLSTFSITLQMPAQLMSTTGSGFFQGVKQAIGEGFDAALEVILWLIRLVLVLIPIFILIVLPAFFLVRRLRRRRRLQVRPQPQS